MIFLTLSTLLNCWKSREIESTMYLKILPWKHHCVIVTGKAPRIAVNPACDVIKNGRGLNFRCRYWRIFVVFREGRFWRCLKKHSIQNCVVEKIKTCFWKIENYWFVITIASDFYTFFKERLCDDYSDDFLFRYISKDIVFFDFYAFLQYQRCVIIVVYWVWRQSLH